ncbi:unnamed protein product [Boreogadus saida]
MNEDNTILDRFEMTGVPLLEVDQDKAEDEAQVTSNTSLESLAFQHAGQRWPSTSVEEEKLQDILGPEDQEAIVDKCNHILSLLDRNQALSDTPAVYR